MILGEMRLSSSRSENVCLASDDDAPLVPAESVWSPRDAASAPHSSPKNEPSFCCSDARYSAAFSTSTRSSASSTACGERRRQRQLLRRSRREAPNPSLSQREKESVCPGLTLRRECVCVCVPGSAAPRACTGRARRGSRPRRTRRTCATDESAKGRLPSSLTERFQRSLARSPISRARARLSSPPDTFGGCRAGARRVLAADDPLRQCVSVHLDSHVALQQSHPRDALFAQQQHVGITRWREMGLFLITRKSQHGVFLINLGKGN